MPHLSTEKLGTVGAIVVAAACPVCFPKLALIGAAFGLGVFAPFEGYLALAVQALAVLALVGQWVAFRVHRNRWLLAFAAATTLLMFVGFYAVPSAILLQLSLLGLAAASVWLYLERRRCVKCTREPLHETVSAAATLGEPGHER